MTEFVSAPWPWYVAGPLIGLMVPALLLLTGKAFGISSSLRHLCAATIPGRADYFRYDWRRQGGWNLALVLGIAVGGLIAATLMNGTATIALAPDTAEALRGLGITDFDGLVPDDLISWEALASGPGLVAIVFGGFLVGFGTRYAGGCTSGHGITGMATFQRASLIAMVGFFVGGLLGTYLLLPLLL